MVIALTDPQLNKWLYRTFPPALTLRPNLWNGLAGCWKPSLGVTGDTLRDVSGFANHGTINGADWIRRNGYALNFVRVNADNVTLLSSKILDMTRGSIITWIDLTTTADAKDYVFDLETPRIVFFFASTGEFKIHTAGLELISPDVLSTDRTHIGATWNSATNLRVLYLNGKEVISSASGIDTSATPSGNVAIGSRHTPTDEYLGAALDDTCLYSRDITANEMMDMYINSNAMFQLRDRVFKAPAVAGGRIMSSLVNRGGLVGYGGIAGTGGGLAG